MVTLRHTPSVLLHVSQVFHRLINRNNADLGKGVPRQHVTHEAWELLFFIFSRKRPGSASLFSPPPTSKCVFQDRKRATRSDARLHDFNRRKWRHFSYLFSCLPQNSGFAFWFGCCRLFFGCLGVRCPGMNRFPLKRTIEIHRARAFSENGVDFLTKPSSRRSLVFSPT